MKNISFENKENQAIPNVTFLTRSEGDWKKRTSDELFKGKRVIVFALPGAFTPTCSSSHLPRYNQLVPTFKKAGIDSVLVISVNDAFVMEAWEADQRADNISFIADGNGEFSEKMGLLVDKSDIGFGKRSWRYSMVVNDGTIEKMFIEPVKDGDPFEVSDADTMLTYIAPNLKPEPAITLFTKPGCPHCARAKSALAKKGLGYEEIVVGTDANITALRAVSGQMTVPQVFIDGEAIGGADQLADYLKS